MKKWFGFSLGTLLGISHLGMSGMISQGIKIPKINLPIGESLKKSINLKEDQIALSEKKRKKAKFQRNIVGLASMALTVLTLITR